MILTRSAAFAPGSWNAETRTFDATFSTGAAVTRHDARGAYLELLDLSAVDPSALIGMTVFTDHDQSSRAAVGTVTAARLEGGALVGTIRLSAADDVASVRVKVAEGVIRGVSIGYAAARKTPGTDASGRRTITVSPRIREISLVGIPADPHSTIRNNPMESETTPEEERIAYRAEVREIATRAALPATWADAQIDAEADLTAVRAAAFDAIQARRPAIRASVGASSEDPAHGFALREEALAARMSGHEPSAGARQFMAHGFADHAALSLRSAGENIGTLSREGLLRRAMAHGTSDFTNLLTGAGNRVLRQAYDRAPCALREVASRVLAPDFRANDLLALGGLGLLNEVTEAGEITATSTVEAKESWKLKTFAKAFNLSRAAMVNDDLGAFGRVTAELGRAAAETENAALASLLMANPVMGDGLTLFHATRGNLEGTASQLEFGSLGSAREKMRNQKGLSGEFIGVAPAFLLVSPQNESEAELALNYFVTGYPGPLQMQNPFYQKLTILVEPRLTGTPWYVFADPALSPVLLLGHLASAPGPQISARDGWETLAREFRVVLDFGVAATDFRGVVKNPGL